VTLRGLDLDDIVERALGGQRRAVGQLLSVAERGGAQADRLTATLHGRSAGAHIVGITGPPGSGKSTLVGRLAAAAAASGANPAVLAVDPSSPLTGGAILGDRIRIDRTGGDVFVRSIATRGHAGGLAVAVPGAIRVLDATGFDPIIVETVGVGQVEVDIAAMADTTVVVANPGTGDAVQANKAGLLEIADIFVVNKADLPDAEALRLDLERMLDLSHMTGHEAYRGRRAPIVLTESLSGTGIDELWAEIIDHRTLLDASDARRLRQLLRLRAEVEALVAGRIHQLTHAAFDSPAGERILADLASGRIDPVAAAEIVLDEGTAFRDA
jgi:LAO/AO transport system kinase